jgi:hypothetical protein
MTEQEINEAIADLAMLWGDVEWWEEQGLSRVRPTLKTAVNAARQLQAELENRKQASRDLIERTLNHAREIDRLNRERRWYYVEDMLPEVGVDVIVCWCDNKIETAHREIHFIGENVVNNWIGETRVGEPTHWMPLPNKPTK